ncbi:MAG: phosphotransferase [Labilithrix sp.]|nr:phosphotransferase [Labilithrix sp.]
MNDDPTTPSAADLIARAHAAGLPLTAVDEVLDTSGLDFVVLRAKDAAGGAWIVRAPRRDAAARAAEVEARVLRLVAARLDVAVPAWRVHTRDVIAYPLLPGTPAVTFGAEGPCWNVIDPKAVPGAFLDSVAAALTALWTLSDTALVEAGVPRVSVADARADLARAIEATREVLAPPDHLLCRWQRWLADDRLWLSRVALVHGDLHPGHMLVGADGALVGLLDWTEAKVTDPSVDLALFYGAFGERALGELLARIERAGAPVESTLARHAAERWSAFPAVLAEWALRNGNEDVVAHARALLEAGV